MTISTQITYYHPHNLVSDQEQGMNITCSSSLTISLSISMTKKIATFIDLGKAINCVDHEILLSKLKQYCAYSTPLRWISTIQQLQR